VQSGRGVFLGLGATGHTCRAGRQCTTGQLQFWQHRLYPPSKAVFFSLQPPHRANQIDRHGLM
jgi:hypothetical protein